ncbi:MAG: glycosyltransferase, partial [Thermoleophilaceae bacterium]|nr:glycosyltransferase [Thermoleophilaceae bacterium]
MSANSDADDGMLERLLETEELRTDSRERERELRAELEDLEERCLDRDALDWALKRERKDRRKLQSRLREREELAPADSTGPGTSSAPPAAGSAERALATLVDDVVAEQRAQPSRCEALTGSGTLAYALAEPPVPSLAVPTGPVNWPEVRVACVLDQFSRLAFGYEFDLVDLYPDTWQDQIDVARPDLLLVESAWRGVDDLWRHKVSRPGEDNLPRLVKYCRGLGIPTVFWNKEDPANFKHFAHNAPLFDQVFTTDSDCLPRYSELVNHRRIDVLPFAAAPRIHNPIRVPGGRTRDVAFAGTYYAIKHPDRKVQMQAVLDPARDFGLHIFSRVMNHANYTFPDEYLPHIVGSLAYSDLLSAHKMYRAFINVNSVIGSPSMCARRIFELLASGASVVSGVSPAIEALLGPGLVHESGDPATTAAALEAILGDQDARDRAAVRGLRTVLNGHTYADRAISVCQAIGLSLRKDGATVTVVAAVEGTDALAGLRANLARQTLVPDEVIMVGRGARTAAESGALAGVCGDVAHVEGHPSAALGPELAEAVRRATG